MSDEQIDFGQGGDDGQDTAGSVQPINDGETLYNATLRRTSENLRRRMEVLRRAVEDLKYLADYDRGYAFYSSALWTSPGDGTIVATDDLYIIPMLSPGLTSGGRDLGAKLILSGVPYLGTVPNEISIVASSAHTGQRGYADGADLDGAALSVGANGITIAFAPQAITGGPGSITAAVTGNPKRNVVISYGTNTPTTVLDIVSFINADASSQGTWGVRHLFRASTTTGSATFSATLAPTKLRGGYDAETIQVTAAQLADFFLTSENVLQTGETLAVAFEPGAVETGGSGGRRQSLIDLPSDRTGGNTNNITPSVGSKLFNTGRNPELIPYSFPICKYFGGVFHFADGTRLFDDMPVQLGDSIAIFNRYANLSGGRGSGASMIGYEGSGNWNADAGSPTTLPSNLINATISTIVSQLAAMTTNNGGSRRIGGEVAAGSANVGSLPFSLTAASIRQQLEQLLNGVSSDTVGGGINRRVSERGHQMLGARPILKRLGDGLGTPTAGVQTLHVRFGSTGQQDGRTYFGTTEHVNQGIFTSNPIAFRDIGDTAKELLADNVIESTATGTDWIKFSDLSTSDFARLMRCIPVVTHLGDTYGTGGAPPLPGVMIEIVGLTAGPSGHGSGLYFIVDLADNEMQLLCNDGVTAANFTSAVFSSVTTRATVLGGVRLEQGLGSEVLRVVVPPSTYGGIHVHASDSVTDVTGTPTYQRKPWMHVFMPDPASTALGSAYLGALFYGNSAVWFESATKERSTGNILVTADAAKLRGQENSLAIDATQNHHHGHQHTRTIMYTTPYSPTGFTQLVAPFAGVGVVTSASSPAVTALLPSGVTLAGLVSTKLQKLAVILRCVMRITTTGMTIGQRLDLCVGFHVGGMVAYRHHMNIYAPGSSPTVHVFSWQCTVPVYVTDASPYSAGQFFIRCGAKGFTGAELAELTEDGTVASGDTVDASTSISFTGTNSFLTIKEIGGVFGYKD